MNTLLIAFSLLMTIFVCLAIAGLVWIVRAAKKSGHPKYRTILVTCTTLSLILLIIWSTWAQSTAPRIRAEINKIKGTYENSTNALVKAEAALATASGYETRITGLQQNQQTLEANQMTLHRDATNTATKISHLETTSKTTIARLAQLEQEMKDVKESRKAVISYNDGIRIPETLEPQIPQVPQVVFIPTNSPVDPVWQARLISLENKVAENAESTSKQFGELNTTLKAINRNITAIVTRPQTSAVAEATKAGDDLNKKRLQELQTLKAAAPKESLNNPISSAPVLRVNTGYMSGKPFWRTVGSVFGTANDRRMLSYEVDVYLLKPVEIEQAKKAVEAGILAFHKDRAKHYAYTDPLNGNDRADFLNDFSHRFKDGLKDIKGAKWNEILLLKEAHYAVTKPEEIDQSRSITTTSK